MFHTSMSLITYSIKVIVKQTPPPNTPPPDFFSSPIWSFLSGIGGIAAVIAIPVTVLVTIYLYRKQQRQAEAERTVKEVVYELISDAPIANVNRAVADRVKILFDDQPVQDLYLLILKLTNKGNIAVKPEDYAEPLQITFKGNKIYSCEVLETNPANLITENALKSFLTLEGESVKLTTILLNPDESLSIKVLLAGSQRDIDVRARIADGKLITPDELRMRQMQLRREKLRIFNRITIGYSAAFIILQIVVIITIFDTPIFPKTIFDMILAAIVIIALIYGYITYKNLIWIA